MAARSHETAIVQPAPEPVDPWGPDGYASKPSFYAPLTYDRPSDTEPPVLAPQVKPEAQTLPPLIVPLDNGWKAVVKPPNRRVSDEHRSGQGRVYLAHVYDDSDNARGIHILKQTPLGKAQAGYAMQLTPAGEIEQSGAIEDSGPSMLREVAVMRHIHRRGMELFGRPGVPWTVAYGHDDEYQYMLQELAAGGRLSQHIKLGHRLPVLQIMRNLMEAIVAAEDDTPLSGEFGGAISRYGGLIYHDIKPGNIIHDLQTGETLLIDGGAAHGRLQRDYKPGGFRGTDIWMAPEQCDGYKQILQTNQYQLALLWLELRTSGGYSRLRQRMNPDEYTITYLYQTANGYHWEGMNQLMIEYDIPYEEQRIMLRALQPNPEDRWPSTRVMLNELTRYLARSARPPSGTGNQSWVRRIDLVPAGIPDLTTQPLAGVPRGAIRARAS